MNIFEITDYKLFLKTFIKSKPKAGRGQVGHLAKLLDVNSTMVSQIVSGDKDFTLEQSIKVCGYLSLNKLETDYFLLLVQIARAGTLNLKKHFIEKREELKKDSLKIAKRIPHERKLSDLDKSVFYSSSLYSAVHLYTSVNEGQRIEQILKKFDLSMERGKEILDFLVDTGLCLLEGGLYSMGVQSTHVEKGSPFLIKHHSNWRIAAIQKSENLTDEELMFTANISLSKKDFGVLREVIMKTIEDMADKVKDSKAEDIANVNFDLFWIGKDR